MPRKNPAAVALGRRGGKVGGLSTSDAKATAARENGKRGGRPPKMCSCGVPLAKHSPDMLADCRTGRKK